MSHITCNSASLNAAACWGWYWSGPAGARIDPRHLLSLGKRHLARPFSGWYRNNSSFLRTLCSHIAGMWCFHGNALRCLRPMRSSHGRHQGVHVVRGWALPGREVRVITIGPWVMNFPCIYTSAVKQCKPWDVQIASNKFLSGKARQTLFLKDHDRQHADNKISFKRPDPVLLFFLLGLSNYPVNGVCILWDSVVVSWALNSYLGSFLSRGFRRKETFK